jgi:hypothetical protein
MTAVLRDPEGLLSAWEAGAQQAPAARGAAVLSATRGGQWLDRPWGDVAREAARALGGRAVPAVVRCPGCGEFVEADLPLEGVGGGAASVTVALGGRSVEVRSPTVRDLVAAADGPDPRAVLLQRCVAQGCGPGDEAALAQAFDALVGDALPEAALECPGCGVPFTAVVDVTALLWQRVERDAPALLRDVADLAVAFGWSEEQVLALPPGRRRAYLEMARR